MRNQKLVNAVEAYLLALKNHMENPTKRNFQYLTEAESKLTPVLAIESDKEDITEMFADLRDYWNTLQADEK